MVDLIFTYGYLQSHYQTKKGVPPFDFELIGSATITGLLYQVSDYPGLVLSKDVSTLVYGEIIRLKSTTDIFKLDLYEHSKPTYKGTDAEYNRVLIDVSTSEMNYQCWAYEYILPVDEVKRIMSGKY